MKCETISEANPDIAGIGIILAFGLQALISLLLSATARLLLSNLFPLTGRNGKGSWRTFLKSVRDWLVGPNIRFVKKLWTNVRHAIRTVDPGDRGEAKARKAIQVIAESIMKEILHGSNDRVHPALLPSDDENLLRDHLILNRIINYAQREFGTAYRRSLIRSNFSKNITKTQEKVQELICRVLLVASDAQTVTGIALIITAMVQQKSLSLYHLHVIYDTINLTTVSNIAAMSCVYDDHLESKHVRHYSIGIFGLLYTGFTIMLAVRLNGWDDALPGRCYATSKIALPNAKHPLIDQGYLGVTSFYVYFLMFCATILCRMPSQRLYWQQSIIIVGTVQFILHVYTLVALRISNQPLLDNVALEDEWGFGQVIAIVMLAATLLECAKGLEEYFSWKRKEKLTSSNELVLSQMEPEAAP